MTEKFTKSLYGAICAGILAQLPGTIVHAADSSPAAPSNSSDQVRAVPRFSVGYMDRSIEPGGDFYRYANGTWVKQNPVPADKSRWGAFMELQERNWSLIHAILQETARQKPAPNSQSQKVADFFKSAMDTNRLEQLGFKPLEPELQRIESLKDTADLMRLLAGFHGHGIGAGFATSASADLKNSGFYACYIGQGGLGLPDRDYYLTESFSKQRQAYAAHVARMFALLGEGAAAAEAHAGTVLRMETTLAQNSKSRVDLRDPISNYHKFPVNTVLTAHPEMAFKTYLNSAGLESLPEIIIRQPEFFANVDHMLKEIPLADWKTYLRWHLLRATAPYLHAAAEEEAFAFYGSILRDQQAQEPRWQRAARVIDAEIGEALGQMFVEKYFPPAARSRMNELVGNIKDVFRDRLKKLDWMTDATRARALAKFDRFTQKIGHPDKFRDYSLVEVRADDYLGNVWRAEAFESRRQLRRVGQPVDRTEWRMTPETVNAYFSPPLNEIVFPAGILQPPFFDMEMDDAVNYGGIGVVIGHEITHGYDDQGRKYDEEGNLNDWWTETDAKDFLARAQKVVDQYNSYEPLPGMHVNGQLTLGENIADLGGASVAFEALQRALAKDSSKRKLIDGFTAEQRFFLSFSQIWRTNCRDAEMRRLITVDPHSPGQFRAIGAHVNLQEFYDAFGIKPGAPIWRPPDARAKIW